jgi:glycerol-1-phosphate dehydrogenase [NAD(P)+]
MKLEATTQHSPPTLHARPRRWSALNNHYIDSAVPPSYMLSRVHRMELPRVVIVGPDAIRALGEEVRALGERRSLVVTSDKPLRIAGKGVEEALDGGQVEHEILRIEKRSLPGDVEEINSHLRSSGSNLIIAVGGGRVIDAAKLAASKAPARLFSVPTAASHDGICSPLVSFPSSERRYSFYATTAFEIVADTRIIAGAPYRLTASGCGDIMAKYTAVRDWKLSHLLRGEYFGEYAASLAEASVSRVIENADLIRTGTEAGVRLVVEALIHCGTIISIAGSSRPCSGSEHLFSHALDMIAERPALHGEQVGVGTILMAYLQGADWKLIRDTLRRVGAPTTCSELGMDEDTVVRALVAAHAIRPDRYTILGERGLSAEAAKNLILACGVAG